MITRFLLADRKCKKLKSLLDHQPSCRAWRLPFIEPLIFLSNPELKNILSEPGGIRICQRDRDNAPGIIAALKFRNAPALKQDVPLFNRPTSAASPAPSTKQASALPSVTAASPTTN